MNAARWDPWQPEREPARERERGDQMVTVVFDVMAATHLEAVEHVAARLTGFPARVEPSDGAPFVESWWFPEAADKAVDRNDRPVASLRWEVDSMWLL